MILPAYVLFQSTPPMQGATDVSLADVADQVFQSTPPMQGATKKEFVICLIPDVSIHAPYAGSDPAGIDPSHSSYGFNPRPLCRERRQGNWTETHTGCFNPRPLCRERRDRVCPITQSSGVSIHAPYAGSDVSESSRCNTFGKFQSTPPMQGATPVALFNRVRLGVSIHAPYAGSDQLPA